MSVSTLDGTPMAANKPVKIDAILYASSSYWTRLELYHAPNANEPTWTYVTTLYPAWSGSQIVSTTFILPEGALQAIRGRVTSTNSSPTPCAGIAQSTIDHDDLAFAVGPAPQDTTPPTVTLTSPRAGTIVPQTITLTASATDNVGVERVEFYGDGALVGTATTAPYTFTWDASAGPHTVFARAYDTKGNVGTSATVSVESNPRPSVWFIEPEPNAFFTGQYHVVAGASDETGVTQVQFIVGTVARATDTTPPYEATLAIEGVHTVIARAFDAVGNTTDATITIRNDTRPPQVAITSPASHMTLHGVWNITAATFDDVGTQRVEFFAGDVPQGVVTTEPYVVSWDSRLFQTGPAAKAVTLKARAYDHAGRSAETTSTVYVYNDITPPVITLTAPANGAVVSGMVTIRVTASDNDAPPRVDFSLDGGPPFAADSFAPYEAHWDSRLVSNGAHVLTVTAIDRQGNEASQFIEIEVDNDQAPPTVALTAPTDGATVEGVVTLVANAHDDKGVTKVEFLVNGALQTTVTSAPWTFAWNTRATWGYNGPRTLLARAYDAAGNVTTSAPVNITVTNDWQSPTVVITAPSAGAYVTGLVPVTVEATDNRAVVRVDFSVDYQVIATRNTAPYVFLWDTRTLTPGLHIMGAMSHDAAGNTSSVTWGVFVIKDEAPPHATMDWPRSGDVVWGEIFLQASAQDNLGVTRVEFLVDGAVVGQDDTYPYYIHWDTTTVSNGSHAITARAWDASENTHVSEELIVEVDNIGLGGEARYNETYQAPTCLRTESVCDSGDLLVGRGPLGPELNTPNTLAGSCPDGTTGVFHAEESVERIWVETVNRGPLFEGDLVNIVVDVYAWGKGDFLDVYHAPDADNPVWSLMSTTPAVARGPHTMTTTMTLPPGRRQAIRANFRFRGSPSICSTGAYDESDDLVFAVAPW
ncbi:MULTISPECIES: Ig-like domain-containing protein [Myxococcus]|uniref:Ig-like domain-containing protein n=1 Tax=Myxococcus TaxID=32 RepID=UPI001144052D|nr:MULTISPECIES: Ig-like domain-containing protein [Myxococcus]NOK02470.1 Ig-like domain-containing protein [Myxococcus xanthus]